MCEQPDNTRKRTYITPRTTAKIIETAPLLVQSNGISIHNRYSDQPALSKSVWFDIGIEDVTQDSIYSWNMEESASNLEDFTNY